MCRERLSTKVEVSELQAVVADLPGNTAEAQDESGHDGATSKVHIIHPRSPRIQLATAHLFLASETACPPVLHVSPMP